MINLDIDTSDLSAEFELSRTDVDNMLQYTVEEVAASFARQWEIEAKSVLNQSRNEYVNSIQVTKRNKFTAVVYLNPASWLANAIEMGTSEFDMKKGFLKSNKIKYTSKGKPYLTIPFRFGTPQAIGDSSAFSGIMPTQIYSQVKKQAPKAALKLSSIPQQFHIPKSAALRKQTKSGNFANITKKTEMTSIYEGMRKTQGGYVTFRRVSLNSDPSSWIHPGFQKKDLAGTALGKLNVPQIVDISIDN